MKTKSNLVASTLGGLTLALCLAPGARAEPAQPAGADRFPISVESIEAKRASVFAEADTNGDGLVSESEFMAFEPERGHHRLPMGFHGRPPGMAPGGRAGEAPSEEQMSAMDDELFAALDSNGDGSLARSEFSHEALMQARRTQRKQDMFERMDADTDGYLSPTEFPPAHMASLDANGDGEISRDEMPRRGRPGGS